MVKAMIVSVRSMSKAWAFRLMVAALLVPMFVAGPVPVSNAATRVQPVLLNMAAQQPNAVVGVIVQKTVKDNSVEQTAARLGGTVTKDLHIINAFAANMSAKATIELSNSAGVRYVSLDSPTVKSGSSSPTIDTSRLTNAYIKTIGADQLWNVSPGYLQGQNVGVAVVDSGSSYVNDFRTSSSNTTSRIVMSTRFGNFSGSTADRYGHGTHVQGIIGGNGSYSNGAYIGVAPKVNLVSLKVSDDTGAGTTSAVVDALQWALNNKSTYNIRVVNLSLNSTVVESYHTNPIDAAAEILWFNGIVVVASAGNNGGAAGALYAPANDPFVITVGATDDRGTNSISDDTIATFSAYGTTLDGVVKPDLVAPGTNIVSAKADGNNIVLVNQHPSNVVDGYYFKMSGTSMAAPMVSGAVALLLQDEPNLTPDQVKYRLKSTAATTSRWAGYSALKAGAGYLDVYAAVTGTSTANANTGTQASRLLWTGSSPVTWNSVNWNSVNWNSVNWNSVNWNSVNWNSVNWNSDYWGH